MTPSVIARQVREFYRGPNLPGVNLTEVMEGVDLALATAKVGEHNSILALLFHVDYYVGGILAVLEGGELSIRDKYSFNHPILTSEVAWQELKAEVFQRGETFAQAIENLPPERLTESFVKEAYGDYHRNLTGMIQHAYYHLGQMRLIKKLLIAER